MGVDDVRGGDLLGDPFSLYARLREQAPVWQLPGSDAFFVTGWRLVVEATGRPEDFSNHFRHTLFRREDDGIGVIAFDAGTDVLAGADPPLHTEHRRLFFPQLVQERIARLEPEVAALADEHVGPVVADGGGDAAALVAGPIPARIVVEHVIGIEGHDVALTGRWVDAGARLMGGRLTLEEMGPAAEEAAGMLPWVSEHLDAAIGAGRDGDVLGAAAGGVRSGSLTRDEAAFALMVLIGAGAETTTSLIGNAIRILAERPELQDQLRRQPALVAPFIEEVLRLEAPFRFHPRTATRATSLGGVAVPAGALVALWWAAANRDESVFERADELVLDRASHPMHLAFGRGIHHCVGAPLARLEARVVLTTLLARTAAFSLDPGDPPQPVDSLWVNRQQRLPLIVTGAARRT